ncbi:AAA family ATPase [Thermodesulfobacteriota bacterium]
MELHALILKNFRTFYKDHTVAFSPAKNKKVTVIHAENQSGKTNFVDAFRWAFYGKILGEQPDQIVNHLSLSDINIGESAKAEVTVIFSHEKKIYNVCREIYEKKISENKSEKDEVKFTVNITKPDGKTTKSHKPVNVIENILPQGMDQYFFLAGEHMKRLGEEDSKEQIKEAIKILMGLEIIDRAKNHLKGPVKKEFRDELIKYASSDEKIILAKIEEYEKENTKYKNGISNANENIKALEKEKEAIAEQLRKGEKTREIQKKRDELEKTIDMLRNKIASIEKSIMNTFSQEGYLAFAKEIVINTMEIAKDKRKKGIIPANVRYQFILDLLEIGKCICGRGLIKGEEPYQLVEALKNIDVSTEHENAFSEIGNAAAGLKRAHEMFPSKIQDLCKKRGEDQNLLSISDELLTEITGQYDGKEYENQRDLINKEKAIKDQIDENKRTLWINRDRIASNNKEIDKLESKREQAITSNKKHEIAKKRLSICRNVTKFLEDLHYSLMQRDRIDLEKKMNNIFKEAISGRENAFIELSSEFEMSVKKIMEDGGTKILPKSGAQSQITCLSFITSIIQLAKENLNKPNNMFVRGGLYPLVLDSPFGVMAEDYRKRATKMLTDNTYQLVILVAPQQWDESIEKELTEHIGYRYIFHHYTSIPSKEINMSIEGKLYTLSEYVSGKQRTVIEEVK